MKKELLIQRLSKDIFIAAFFNLTTATLTNYKKSDLLKYKRVYKALKDIYLYNINSLDQTTLENYIKNSKDFIYFLKNENIFDNLRVV